MSILYFTYHCKVAWRLYFENRPESVLNSSDIFSDMKMFIDLVEHSWWTAAATNTYYFVSYAVCVVRSYSIPLSSVIDLGAFLYIIFNFYFLFVLTDAIWHKFHFCGTHIWLKLQMKMKKREQIICFAIIFGLYAYTLYCSDPHSYNTQMYT